MEGNQAPGSVQATNPTEDILEESVRILNTQVDELSGIYNVQKEELEKLQFTQNIASFKVLQKNVRALDTNMTKEDMVNILHDWEHNFQNFVEFSHNIIRMAVQMDKEITNLKNENRNLATNLDTISKDFEDLKTDREKLRKKLELSQKSVPHSENAALTRDLRVKTEEIQKFNAQISELKTKLEEESRRLAGSLDQNKELKDKLEVQAQEFKKAEDDIKELLNSVREKTKENERLNKLLVEKDTAIASKDQTIAENENIKTLVANANFAMAKIKDLNTSLSEQIKNMVPSQDLVQANQIIADLSSERNNLRAAREKLTVDLGALQNVHDILSKTKAENEAAMTHVHQSLIADNKILKEENKKSQEEIDWLVTEVTNYKKERDIKQNWILDLESKIRTNETEIKGLRTNISKMDAEIRDSNQELNKWRTAQRVYQEQGLQQIQNN